VPVFMNGQDVKEIGGPGKIELRRCNKKLGTKWSAGNKSIGSCILILDEYANFSSLIANGDTTAVVQVMNQIGYSLALDLIICRKNNLHLVGVDLSPFQRGRIRAQIKTLAHHRCCPSQGNNKENVKSQSSILYLNKNIRSKFN